MPPGDSIFAQAESPSLLLASLRIALALALIVGGAWAWLYWHRRVKGPNRRMEVLERAMLARGAGVALLRVGERLLLLGVSSERVTMLRELETEDDETGTDSFGDVLEATGAKREVAR